MLSLYGPTFAKAQTQSKNTFSPCHLQIFELFCVTSSYTPSSMLVGRAKARCNTGAKRILYTSMVNTYSGDLMIPQGATRQWPFDKIALPHSSISHEYLGLLSNLRCLLLPHESTLNSCKVFVKECDLEMGANIWELKMLQRDKRGWPPHALQ